MVAAGTAAGGGVGDLGLGLVSVAGASCEEASAGRFGEGEGARGGALTLWGRPAPPAAVELGGFRLG